MKFEHFALNVAQPLQMAAWYVAHLGLSIVKKMEEPPYMIFMADESGTIMLEIYNNPKAVVLDYQQLHPLKVHLGFESDNPQKDKDRLLQAGATVFSDGILEDGSHLVRLRDPLGLAIQRCKRASPMLRAF